MIGETSLNPKLDFLKDGKRADAHQETVLDPKFMEAIKIALLSYAMKIGGAHTELQSLSTVGLRLEGAKGFIHELINLGKPTKPQETYHDDELRPV